MARRRYQPTILNTVDKPRWIVVREMSRDVIGAVYLPPRTDLRAALQAAADRFVKLGWTIETEDLRWGELFMRRDGGRRLSVEIGSNPFEVLRDPMGSSGQTDHMGRSTCPTCKQAPAMMESCPTCKGVGKVRLRALREIGSDPVA